ncbi:acyl-CoA N-acyltransferase [Talaromyces proteolyticus]|uniref:Acyl-CoA N-acyltransferase n=1 Tax=Talaromyces proteolyticus TaxID=1131652 RepID=A0AAD4PZ09_9EURO|nr:acyl-CoA N-acyltransferase [Talaromyces proteolyticus]KAH8695932.1 acyl-CoA N-acyltransferase [Talaromyces proteolyticus]
MPSKNITISVLPATEEDYLALAQVESQAFSDPDDTSSDVPSTIGGVMFGPPSAEGQAARAKDLAKLVRTVPGMRLFKAVAHDPDAACDNYTKTIGIGGWIYYTDPHPTEDPWEDKPWEGARDPRACNDYFGEFSRRKTRIMGGKRFAYLQVLAILPDYQGLGAGKALLRQGLEEAAKLDLHEAYLEASIAGRPLYRKFGWEDVDVQVVDLSKYGAKGTVTNFCMYRKQQGTEIYN